MASYNRPDEFMGNIFTNFVTKTTVGKIAAKAFSIGTYVPGLSQVSNVNKIAMSAAADPKGMIANVSKGAAAGGSIGSAIPGVGTLIGTLVGGYAGASLTGLPTVTNKQAATDPQVISPQVDQTPAYDTSAFVSGLIASQKPSIANISMYSLAGVAAVVTLIMLFKKG
jgi:hypothetical protein